MSCLHAIYCNKAGRWISSPSQNEQNTDAPVEAEVLLTEAMQHKEAMSASRGVFRDGMQFCRL